MAEEFIQKLARQAGKITLKFFNKAEVKYAKKFALDIVTQADLESNRFLVEEIKKMFPNDGIISEEEKEFNTEAKHVWVIDPLDGTVNFSKGIPVYCILIARASAGIVDLGVIYDPVHEDMYFAQRGKGAFRNGQQIRCSQEDDLNKVVGGAGGILRERNIELYKRLLEANPEKRAHLTNIFCGGMTAAHVASGKRDWMVFFGGVHGIMQHLH